MKVKLRAAGCWFLNDMKGQGVAHTTQVTCFENILRIRRFIYSIYILHFILLRCVVEMIDLPWSVVSLVKPCFQVPFRALNFV